MTLLGWLVVHTVVAGLCGVAARIQIGAFLLSTESLNSPRRGRRYYYRYLIFNLYYLLSIMFMLIFVGPFKEQIAAHAAHRNLMGWAYMAICLLPASLLFYLDWRFIAWCDEMKIAARESAKRYWK